MDQSPTDIAGERLVRKAPDRPLPLEAGDIAYISDSLKAVAQAYSLDAVPDVPLHLIPGRVLMRRMIDLRHQLRPHTDEQREAWGKLAGAILVLDTACAFANEHERARRQRAESPEPE